MLNSEATGPLEGCAGLLVQGLGSHLQWLTGSNIFKSSEPVRRTSLRMLDDSQRCEKLSPFLGHGSLTRITARNYGASRFHHRGAVVAGLDSGSAYEEVPSGHCSPRPATESWLDYKPQEKPGQPPSDFGPEADSAQRI
jgi:hypothetical protein